MLPVSSTCQLCLQRKKNVHAREVYTKAYVGQCGDSFCYAGCDSPSCRPVRATVCDDCVGKL